MMILTTGPSGRRLGRPAGRAGGFTLLELVLVMVIICMVLAMGAPSLRGFFASRQTSDAAAQIMALAYYARTQAVAEGRTYRLNLDTQSGKYWLTAQTLGAFTPLSSEFGRIYSLPDGTVATWQAASRTVPLTGRDWIPFYPDGRTAATDILLVGRQGDTQEIVCLSPAERLQLVAQSAGGAQ